MTAQEYTEQGAVNLTQEHMEHINGGEINSRVNGKKKLCKQCSYPLEEIGSGRYKCKKPKVPICPMFGIPTTDYKY
ncbi:MAG: hypothetical protein IKG23_11985 [Clostridia bacterium]|nr:hypothetical protein [Clostridia bacterium]